MTWYKTGTVAVTPGSNAVIGTGTAFIANSRVGDGFRGPDGGWYEVTNIASDTALSIAPPYGDPSAYALAPLQGYVKDSADALRAATQVIASGVTDMQEQVAAATEAAESAGQSKTQATEQAGIATAAVEASTDNKDAAQLAAQQSQTSAQASGTAADRSETARDSIIQSEQAAAASAAAAADSAEQAEAVTVGKAASGDNNDITSLRALSADGFDRIRQGLAPLVGATASVAGVKGLVPAPSIADRLKVLSGAGTWVNLPASAWGSITGNLSAQTDLQAALDAKLDATLVGFAYVYPNGGSESTPANVSLGVRYTNPNPFPGHPVICEAQVLVAGNWERTGWVHTGGSGAAATYGVSSNHRVLSASEEITTQVGTTGVMVHAGYTGGTYPTGAANITAPTPCRVRVWRVKG
ncbi:hypothetical protein ACI77F_26045 [Pseudomonas tritici]|uniref:hypothetical protein n=1 Tax=Pseudomonas tritici TaxID=2745518 RepID=UPI00387B3E22